MPSLRDPPHEVPCAAHLVSSRPLNLIVEVLQMKNGPCGVN